MRALAGFILLLAALTFGVVEFYLAPTDREALVVSASRIFNPTVDSSASPLVKRAPHARTFSPSSSLFAEAAYTRMHDDPEIAAPKSEKTIEEANAAPMPIDQRGQIPGWSTVVTMDMDAEMPAGRGALTPGDDGKLYQLALELQRELKRVGCYSGYLNGHWSSGSKAAMGDFVRRVNAALPFDRPDYALLNLVRGHSGLVCGSDCLPGEVLARNGQCLPSTVLARRPSADAVTTAEAALPVPAPVPARRPVAPLPGRMAVGAPPAVSAEPVLADKAPDNAAAGTPSATEAATGYLDPMAATAESASPSEFAEPSAIPRDPSPLVSRPQYQRPRGVSRAEQGDTRRSRRAGGVNSRLPHNRRYIPPPNYLGALR